MELKAKGVDDVYIEYYNTGKHDLAQVYLKVEADQYIAELKKKIDRCHKYHDEQATKWLAENQKLKDEISKLKHLTQRHERQGGEVTPNANEFTTTVIDDPIIDYGDRKTLRFVCEKCNREIGGTSPYEKFKTFCPSCKNLTWFNPKKKEE